MGVAGARRARLRRVRGVVVTRRGRDLEAQEPMRRARTTFAELGATAWLSALDDQLAALPA